MCTPAAHFDVRFSFPRSGHELWAKSLNPPLTPQEHNQLAPTIANLQELAQSESNSEDVVVAGLATRRKQVPASFKFHSIVVTNFGYSTYEAVLGETVRHNIVFSPLRSDSANGMPAPPPLKRAKLNAPLPSTKVVQAPTVSATSTYRLASLLELPDVQANALDYFRSHLTLDNVVRQLFSSSSVACQGWQDAATDFAVAHWGQVGNSPALKKVQAKVKADKDTDKSMILMALAQKVMAKATEGLGNA